MKKVFFSGSRKLPELNPAIRTRLNRVIANNDKVLVGDANGADKAVQTFFEQEVYKNVVVYCMDGECRNNIGNWEIHPVKSGRKTKDFKYFATKDEEMSREADSGIMIWDRKSSGTLNNMLVLLENRKAFEVYFSPEKKFVTIELHTQLEQLIAKCDEKSKSYFDKKIKLSERMKKLSEPMKSQQGHFHF